MTDIVEQFMDIAKCATYADWKLTQYSEEITVETYCEIYDDDNEVFDFVKLNSNNDTDSYCSELQDSVEIDDRGNNMFLKIRVQVDEDMTLLQMRKRVENFLLATAMGWKKPKSTKKIQLTLKARPATANSRSNFPAFQPCFN